MAKEELYIEAKLDAEQLYADLKKLKSDIEKQKAEFKVETKVSQGAQAVKWTVDSITSSTKKAAEAAKQNADAMEKMNTALEQWAKAYNDMTPEIQEQIKKVNELEQTYKNLQAALKSWVGNTDEIRSALSATKLELSSARSELNKMTKPMKEAKDWATWLFWALKSLGSKSITTWLLSTFWAFSLAWMIKKALTWIINTCKEAVNTFISFESAFAWVRKTIEASEYQFDNFNKQLRDMTTTIPMAYEELAKIAELGWQMGVPLENLTKFTETMAALSVSTNLGLEDAALQFSRIAAVLWIPYQDIDRLGSAVVDLWNNFAATESEITNFSEKIVWTANIVWFTAWDVAWISAAITSVWIASEKWWTAVNKFALTIEDAVDKGWDKLGILAKLTNMTVEDFQKLWKADSWEAFTRVIEWLWDAGSDAVWYIEDLVWTWTRMKEVLLNMAWASGKLREAIEMGNNAYRENIALQEEALKRYGTTESQMTMLNNQIKLQKEQLWEELIPIVIKWKEAMVDLRNWLSNILDWFNQLWEGWKLALVEWGIGAIATLIWFTVNPILWVTIWLLATCWELFVHFAKWTVDESVALKDLHWQLEQVNEELYATQDDIAKLNEDFKKWKINVSEYTEELNKLLEEERKLEKQQKAISDNIIANESISALTEWLSEWVDDRVEALKKVWDTIAAQEEVIIKNRKAVADLTQQYNNWIITFDEYSEWVRKAWEEIGKSNEILKDLKKQEEWATEDLSKYWEAANRAIPYINTLNKYTSDSTELLEILNKMELNTDMSQEEINQLSWELQIFDNEAEKAIKEAILLQKAIIWLSTADDWRGWIFAWDSWVKWAWFFTNVFWAWTKKVEKAKKELASLEQELATLQTTWWQLYSALQTGNQMDVDVALKFSVDNKSKNELNDELYQVNQLMDKYNQESTNWINLDKKKTEITNKLQQMLDEEAETLDDYAASASKAWDAEKELMEIQEKRLENEAQQRVLSLQQAWLNERDYANAVLAVDEWLNKEKEKLSKDWYDMEIDSVNWIIEKYNELKKEAEKAFSWLAWDISSVSKDISSLIDKIKSLRESLTDLDEDKVKDLWERYVDLQQQLEELDKKIAKNKEQTEEWADSWMSVSEAWESIQESIDGANDNVKDYQKEIDKLLDKMKDLQSDTADDLSDRYAEVVEEVQKLNAELDKYTKYDILTDADAKAKADLEQQIASLMSEKAKIEWTLTEAELARAESMVGETETDKILREAQEKQAAYEEELKSYQDMMAMEKEALNSYYEEQKAMSEKYTSLEISNEKNKYDTLVKELEDYAKERQAILDEMDMISQNLTAQEIQNAIINSKKTETELILENYYTQKQLLQDELADYEEQLQKKLKLLTEYYWDIALLNEKYEWVWTFSEDDLEKIKQSVESMSDLKSVSSSSDSALKADLKTQNNLLKEQEEARKMLELIEKNIAKLTDYQLKSRGTDALKEIYNKIVSLQLTATWANVWTWNVTKNSTINQSFNVNNVSDAAVIAAAIRRQIKL